MIFDFFRMMINSLFFILHVGSSSEFPKALSREQEKKYLDRFENHKDIEARNKLIEHNLRLVAHIIKKYYSAGYEQDDLISIGTIGLIKAVNSYTSGKGTRLATYASKCIENEILMHFRSQKKHGGDVYMSDPIDIDKDGNALTLIDIISDNTDIVEDIDLKLKTEKLYKIIGQHLDPREQMIINFRYGLNSHQELTQREIAKKLKISRSYVSRIEKKALGTIYEHFIS